MPSTPHRDIGQPKRKPSKAGHRFERVTDHVLFGRRPVSGWEHPSGLRVLLSVDRTAPVVSYHTWFNVGSRDENIGKTGLAHLLEHLMFNETKNTPYGEFDRLIEAAGGETNAATWCDWTYYYENVPSSELETVVALEAERMAQLVLRDKQVSSEKDVVLSERRDRVDDDPDGILSEWLYRLAFGDKHPYGWPTIGWESDIRSFSRKDCQDFYNTHYRPDTATLVVAGDVEEHTLLELIERHYGSMEKPQEAGVRRPVSELLAKPFAPRTKEFRLQIPSDRWMIGWAAPPYGDYDHAVLHVASQVMVSGRSSRLFKRLVIRDELATDVRMSVSPFAHVSILELSAVARQGIKAEALEKVAREELQLLAEMGPSEQELLKIKARTELGFLSGLETASGLAEQIGFGMAVTGDPAHAEVRLNEMREVTAADIQRVLTLVLNTPSVALIARPKRKKHSRKKTRSGKARSRKTQKGTAP